MPEPGDRGGECVRCGSRTVLIGHGHVVLGSYCESCELIHGLGASEVTGYCYYHPDNYDSPREGYVERPESDK